MNHMIYLNPHAKYVHTWKMVFLRQFINHFIFMFQAQCESPVTESEAKLLASKLNAPYIETSSKTKSRLKDVFDSAILAALPVTKKKTPFWKKLLCVY